MKKDRKHIEVVPYDPQWPQQFELERGIIQKALSNDLLAIHHVGSTSVPGLAAKPKIDIIAVVKSGKAAINQLEKNGYQYRGEYNIPLHFGFSKRGPVEVNLHVYEEGHPEIELNLIFRDFLRNNQRACEIYAALKRELLLDDSAFERGQTGFCHYTLRKGDFIRSVLDQAGFKRVRMLKCNDETEFNAAKALRKLYPFKDGDAGIIQHDPAYENLLLYEGTHVIGYANLHLLDEQRASLSLLIIEPKMRRRGYGKQMLAWIEKWLKYRNYRYLFVLAPLETEPFFKQCDYVPSPNQISEDPTKIYLGKIL